MARLMSSLVAIGGPRWWPRLQRSRLLPRRRLEAGAHISTRYLSARKRDETAALRTYDFTQADIVTAVEVTDRAVHDWLHEKPLRRGNEERLQAIRQIVLLLDDSLSGRGVGRWFRAHNRLFGARRHLDVLAEGRFRRSSPGRGSIGERTYV